MIPAGILAFILLYFYSSNILINSVYIPMKDGERRFSDPLFLSRMREKKKNQEGDKYGTDEGKSG